MIRKTIISSAIGIATLLLSTTAALAAPKLPWHQEVNRKQCDAVGKVIVNVEQKVVNDVDSGQAGNYWAFDNYKRDIKVFATGTAGEYCALVSYKGKFDAQAGQTSPGNTGVLTGNEDGHFDGGYRAIITGTLLADPTWAKKGSVGTFDYQCDLSANCPGYVSWIAQYFTAGYGFDYGWWGWQYNGHGKHGTWINSSGGNSGDVL